MGCVASMEHQSLLELLKVVARRRSGGQGPRARKLPLNLRFRHLIQLLCFVKTRLAAASPQDVRECALGRPWQNPKRRPGVVSERGWRGPVR